MISFRLSPEEYQMLQEACRDKGVRSVSDLARTAVEKLIFSDGHKDPLTNEVRDLRDRLKAISAEVERLSQIVESR